MRHFIEAENVSNLVINGDMFDSSEDAHRILDGSSFGPALRMLGLDGPSVRVFWLMGSPGHDPLESHGSPEETKQVKILSLCASLACGESCQLQWLDRKTICPPQCHRAQGCFFQKDETQPKSSISAKPVTDLGF